MCSASCVSAPLPEESQPKRHSLASRLSEKFQASLSSEHQKDDDFQTDKKRIRAAENKVAIDACCAIDLLFIHFKGAILYVLEHQNRLDLINLFLIQNVLQHRNPPVL